MLNATVITIITPDRSHANDRKDKDKRHKKPLLNSKGNIALSLYGKRENCPAGYR